MDKHNFKVGDKVKLKGGFYCGMSENDIGVVVAFTAPYIRVDYNIEGKYWFNNYPHLPKEIERVVNVGEQLMLFEI